MKWLIRIGAALAVLIVLLVGALARPQLLLPPVSRTVPTRDLLLAVDLSGSMEATDFVNADGETVDRRINFPFDAKVHPCPDNVNGSAELPAGQNHGVLLVDTSSGIVPVISGSIVMARPAGEPQ